MLKRILKDAVETKSKKKNQDKTLEKLKLTTSEHTQKKTKMSLKKLFGTWVIKSWHWCLCWVLINWEFDKGNAVYKTIMISWVRWKKSVKSVI